MAKYKGYKVQIQLIKENRPSYSVSLNKGPKAVYDLLKDDVELFDREKFLVAYVNRKHKVIGINEVATGSIAGLAVSPREVFKGALLCQASAIVLVHNHPSGDPEPSREDIALTDKLIEGGKLLDVQVLDHVIFGNDIYYSFADQGLIKKGG